LGAIELFSPAMPVVIVELPVLTKPNASVTGGVAP
jgi:hypothetical protein